jgi:CPA1 family monovalent cation:H+ antiporter
LAIRAVTLCGVHDLEIVIASLLVSVAVLNAVASRLQVPYPIVLVLGGLLLGFVPGMPDIELEPDLVLLVFLPPLLFVAAYRSDVRALRYQARALALTSIGLVLVTIGAVAVAGHEVMGLEWPIAFALGAIVSPTDPVAATAIMQRLGAPRRIVTAVEGESLVNDTAALIGYRVAVAVALGEGFSMLDASLEFLLAACGGVALGLAVGWVFNQIRLRLEDSASVITLSLATGYAAFLPAEELHLSGVLAAVSAGLYLGWHAPRIVQPTTRLQATAVWDTLIFLFNATLFVLIGLQLPMVADGLAGDAVAEAIGWGVVVTLTVIGCRFAWLFTTPYLIRALDRRPSQRERRVGARYRVVMAWSGLRGAVSMATALALPLETDAGQALPGRDAVIFVTFVLVLITLVGQGLTLPALMRRLQIESDGEAAEAEEVQARLLVAKAALHELDAVAPEDWADEDTVEQVRASYMLRKHQLAARAGRIRDDGWEDRSLARVQVLRRLHEAERRALLDMYGAGDITAEVMRRIEHDLDIEDEHLEGKARASHPVGPPSAGAQAPAG